MIFTHGNKNYSRWSEYLDEAVKIYNNTIHSSTGKKPNDAVMIRTKENLNDLLNRWIFFPKRNIMNAYINHTPQRVDLRNCSHALLSDKHVELKKLTERVRGS